MQITDVCGTSAVGEEHSVLPMSNEVGAAFRPKFLPVTVISPPDEGLILDRKETEGDSAGGNQNNDGRELLYAP